MGEERETSKVESRKSKADLPLSPAFRDAISQYHSEDMKKTVLFVCTGNAVRSQMAEALARLDWPDVLEPFSGGSNPAGWVHPHAIEAIADLGLDISEAESKAASDFRDEPLDLVVILCDFAAAICREWPNAANVEHCFVEDPTWAEGDEEERYRQFVARRDEIRDIIRNLVEEYGWDKETK